MNTSTRMENIYTRVGIVNDYLPVAVAGMHVYCTPIKRII